MNNCTAKLSGHLKVWLARAVTEKGTHDSAGTRHEYRLCLAVQKMSQKETTRAITSSSDKLHQTEREEMNEELLNGSFQLLILQLKPGAGFFPPPDTHNYSVRGRQNQESPLPTAVIWGFLCWSPFTCQSLTCLPAPGPRGSHWSHKRELDLVCWESPAAVISHISTSGSPQAPGAGPKSLWDFSITQTSCLLFPGEADSTHRARLLSPAWDPAAHLNQDAPPRHRKENHVRKAHPKA